jgi:hypothetical protein
MKITQASLLALALLGILCQGCVSKKRIRAHIWLNNSPIPQEICDREPTLKDYGVYRRLTNGKLEFVSFCEGLASEFLSMHKSDFEKLMNEASDSEKAIRALK